MLSEETYSFGYWLRRRRKALDLTQEALARSVSCSRFAIRKIEADERRPSKRLAERLAERLGVPSGEREAFLEAARSIHRAEALPLDRIPVGNPAATGNALVGRAAERRLLAELLAAVTDASGCVVLIEGEAGIGKTRLVEDFRAHSHGHAALVLPVRCHEIEKATAYQPVVELILQASARTPKKSLETLPKVLLAELAALVPGLGGTMAAPTAAQDFVEARTARLFQAVIRLFAAAAKGRRIVVVVDDLQWADDASLQLIHFLGRQAATSPLVVVCAYRPDARECRGRFSQLVGGLLRERHVHALELARLGLDDTESLVRQSGIGNVDAASLASRLYRESSGNPLIITSILEALRSAEGPAGSSERLPMPDALRMSVASWLRRLTRTDRALLETAAVFGRPFDFQTLARASGASLDEAAHSLRTLLRSHLIRDDATAGLYDFSHDKVREVVYLDIIDARKTYLHKAVAEALEQACEGQADRDEQLAEHYVHAREWRKALHYAMRAAERAVKLFAMRDALHWFDRAVGLAEGPSRADSIALMRLLSMRGSARAVAGQVEDAAHDIRRVVEGARGAGDRAAARDALIQLGMAYRRCDRNGLARQVLEQALEECRAMGDDHGAANTLYHLGTAMWSDGHNRDAIAFHEGAVSACESLGLRDIVAVQAYHGRGESYFSDLQPGEAIRCYERSLALARRIHDRSYECENLMMIGYANTGYMGLGDYSEAERNFEASYRIALDADLQWHIGPALLGLHHSRGCRGAYGEARKGILETRHWLGALKQTRYRIMSHDMLAHLLLDLDMNEQAAEESQRGLDLADQERIRFRRWRLLANNAIARLRLGGGALDAGPSLEQAVAESETHRELCQTIRCLEALAELRLAAGEREASLQAARRLHSLVKAAGMREAEAQARLLAGRAYFSLGDRERAAVELEAVADTAEQIGRLRLVLDAHASLARVHGGDRSEKGRWHESKARRAADAIRASLDGHEPG